MTETPDLRVTENSESGFCLPSKEGWRLDEGPGSRRRPAGAGHDQEFLVEGSGEAPSCKKGAPRGHLHKNDALIIGGGIAGLWCANELSRMGFQAAIVERNPYPGGHVASYCCKATGQCERCGACLLEEALDEVQSSARINFLIRTALTDVRRVNGHFEVAAFQRPARIYPDRCTHCDKCIEVCPGEGALDRSPLDGALCVREDACLFFKDGSCRSCVEACPEGAINLDARGEEIRLDASALVLACGFKPFDPADKPRFGYGRVPGVISGLDLDAMLRSDSFYQGEGEKRIRSVAFIQCVGSRDPKLGLNYCSRVCCGYALRLARLLKHRFEGIEPVMFYMDIQSFDRDFERRLDAARREVRLVRAIPSEVRAGADGRPELIYYGPNETRVSESYDLVVLSIGISPDPANESLGVLLGAGSNQDGFVGSEGEEVSSGAPGVFVAGAVQGPKSITETVTHAIRAAGQVAAYLKQSRQGANN